MEKNFRKRKRGKTRRRGYKERDVTRKKTKRKLNF